MKITGLCRMTEDEARKFIEAIRWPNGPICPHCGNVEGNYPLNGKSTRPGLWKCGVPICRKQFSVTVGTIFERSHIPLRDWVYAFSRMVASKKGISAHQLHREIGVSYKTGWFMCHRIRHALKVDFTNVKKLSGTVEVDETYVGGKPRKGTGKKNKRGRGTKKTPVMVLVERQGNVRTKVICDVTAKTLKGAILDNVARKSAIMTDEMPSYNGIGKSYAGGHSTVNHGAGEYARADGTNTNTAESFFALLKRGMYGTFHHVSKKHLHRYCDEFSFRWDHRKADDCTRTLAALKMVGGKRLMYA